RARVTGTVPLDGGVDFSAPNAPRYLRLLLDGTMLLEIDCALTAAHHTLDEIVAAINAQAGFALASHDAHFLSLTSATNGFAGSIAFQPASAQDARATLFGAPPLVSAGRDAQAAHCTGTRDGSAGFDLRTGSMLTLAVDGAAPVTVDCGGVQRAATTLDEVVAALNTALGAQAATHDGHFVTVTGHVAGAAGSVVFGTPVGTAADAARAIFGVLPRTFAGAPAIAARVIGTADLAGGIDVGGTRSLQLALDGGAPRTIDLRGIAPFDPATKTRHATVQQICGAIDAALGAAVATTDGHVVTLTSPTTGATSRIAVVPLDAVREQRFVTRAFVTDDAASQLFGVPRRTAFGSDASAAHVAGTKDLSRGVDLTAARGLRVALDGGPFVDVDCAAKSPRPRAALVTEIADALNGQLGAPVAATDGKMLTLTSTGAGATSRIAFGAGGDATTLLFGGPATARGQDAVGVIFRATVAIPSSGIDLSAADRIAVGIDGGAPVEISCAGPDPAHTSPNQICARINLALGAAVAVPDGPSIVLSTVKRDGTARLDIAVPSTHDATAAILGVTAPRTYRGTDAHPAQVTSPALHEPLDLRATRFLRIALDGGAPLDVNCAGANPAATSIDEVVAAVNAAAPHLAARAGTTIVLTSASTGNGSRIDLLPSSTGDARAILFGSVADVTTGAAPSAATITGSVKLLAPVNLAEQGTLQLAIDDGEPFTVDVAGTAPDRTALDEIVTHLNAVAPGLASATNDGHLQLTSPTAGAESRLDLIPVRALEVVEYPPDWHDEAHGVRHGDTFMLDNDGAAESTLAVTFGAPSGVDGPELVALDAGLRLRLATTVAVGESVRVRAATPAGLVAERVRADGSVVPVPADAVISTPIGVRAGVPFPGERALRSVHATQSLMLDDPESPYVVRLDALDALPGITVQVTEVDAAARLYDVEIAFTPTSGPPVVETYAGVTIGAGPTADEHPGLAGRVLVASKLVRATEVDKAAVLRLPRGRTTWCYLDCDGARFDSARFDHAVFAGGTCVEDGVFDVSLFSATAPPTGAKRVVFAGARSTAPATAVALRWQRFAPGAFTVNLPAELPAAFGARFDSGRFATAGGAPETYDDVVFDPADDPDSILNRVKSALVTVTPAARVPIGFEGFVMPFHQPRERFLTLGSATAPAKLFLTENGVTGYYAFTATGNGTWGNAIAVTARVAGPARWDLTVGFDGARFESARATALAGDAVAGDPLPALTAQILTPRPVGVVQAKAAGIRAAVTRDRAELTAS
ncbi:MAG: hypothetical protein JO103_02890, partial [Candidatus Eremiobacteraeota bacterium]|nr:hypothetical protein [Candidatus Eremiobacteraeota bacterium]